MLKEINIFQSLYFTVSYHPYDDRHEAIPRLWTWCKSLKHTHGVGWFRSTNEQKHHWCYIKLLMKASLQRKSQRLPCALQRLDKSVHVDVGIGVSNLCCRLAVTVILTLCLSCLIHYTWKQSRDHLLGGIVFFNSNLLKKDQGCPRS